jgi:hypothetical protein
VQQSRTALLSSSTSIFTKPTYIAVSTKVEERAREFTPGERLALRQRLSVPVMEKLRGYLEKIRGEVLPKSPAERAVRYALNQWDALKRFVQDGDLEIDNGASERAKSGRRVGTGELDVFR